MYIKIIDSQNNPTLVNIDRITNIHYAVDEDETAISLNGNVYESTNVVLVKGQITFNIISSLLILQGDLVNLQDVIDREDKLNKLLTFHKTNEGEHKFIKLLDNADKFIATIEEQIKKQPVQPSFNFNLDDNIIN